MGEIINLRRARKARARDRAVDTAAANRALHGRTKAERTAAEIERRRQAALLDGAAIAREDEGGTP
ncbi:DUF4169 family protein [Sphingomonas profundi]|uniref:DUF4169 family protein n=1 Tax=Alterirhizorhabdus profundi TaxID=2681549 RepID=UPI0012E82D35|nr:DUF4169 family protein [Sphingomonas profundi]